MIATLKSQGLSNRAIGRQLGVNHQTINVNTDFKM